jgi:hypothetical protein
MSILPLPVCYVGGELTCEMTRDTHITTKKKAWLTPFKFQPGPHVLLLQHTYALQSRPQGHVPSVPPQDNHHDRSIKLSTKRPAPIVAD